MNLYGIEKAFNDKAKKEGLPPLRFAKEAENALSSMSDGTRRRRGGTRRRRGGTRRQKGGQCGIKAKALTIAIIAAALIGADQILCILAGDAWSDLTSYIGQRGTEYIQGTCMIFRGTLMTGNFSSIYTMLKNMLAVVGGAVAADFAGILSPFRTLCEYVDAAITAREAGEPAPPVPAEAHVVAQAAPAPASASEHVRSRSAGSRRNKSRRRARKNSSRRGKSRQNRRTHKGGARRRSVKRNTRR